MVGAPRSTLRTTAFWTMCSICSHAHWRKCQKTHTFSCGRLHATAIAGPALKPDATPMSMRSIVAACRPVRSASASPPLTKSCGRMSKGFGPLWATRALRRPWRRHSRSARRQIMRWHSLQGRHWSPWKIWSWTLIVCSTKRFATCMTISRRKTWGFVPATRSWRMASRTSGGSARICGPRVWLASLRSPAEKSTKIACPGRHA
mmetsp:Transcript_59541/g.166275  ORF Transcript_59541/g.166275 Transcript_59541/m.166275 type:complete len:204 (-) Transcript_59541:328-939(-)